MAKDTFYIIESAGWIDDFTNTSSQKEARKLQKKMQLVADLRMSGDDSPSEELNIYKVERIS